MRVHATPFLLSTSKYIAESARQFLMREQTFDWMHLQMGGPVKGVNEKRRDMGELCNVPHEAVSGIEDDVMPRAIC